LGSGENDDAEGIRTEVRQSSCREAFVRHAPTGTELRSRSDWCCFPNRL